MWSSLRRNLAESPRAGAVDWETPRAYHFGMGDQTKAPPNGRLTRKRPRGKPFTGADDPRRIENMPPESESVSAVQAPDEDQLAAMRWVVEHKQDRTHQHKQLRQWLKRRPDSFWAAKTRLEEAALAKSGAADTYDEAEERVIALLEQQLKDRPWEKDQ